MTPENPVWESAGRPDLQAVSAIASVVHPGFPERDRVFLNRLSLCPEGVMVLRADHAIHGYVISHPWRRQRPVALDTTLGRLPDDPDCLYLHDIALLQTVRGSGAAKGAIACCEQLAIRLGLRTIALVSLPAATGFWVRRGFQPRPCHGLESYGEGVTYMERAVTGFP